MTAGVNPELRALAAGTGTEVGDTQATVTAPVPDNRPGWRHQSWVSIPQSAERLEEFAKESAYRIARAGQLRGAVKMGRRYVVN